MRFAMGKGDKKKLCRAIATRCEAIAHWPADSAQAETTGGGRRIVDPRVKCSGANLDAAEAPAVGRPHAPADEIASFIVVIAVVRIAAERIRSEAKSDKAMSMESAMKAAVETSMEAASTVATETVCESAG
jgi:hypothetical protein